MRPKILIAGMNKFPNQFSRYVEKMGCEFVRLSGDAGGTIPTNCEAVIITKCQVSHDKFWRVKDEFKKVNKPVFITDYGISPIKERLQAYLSKLPKHKQIVVKREEPTVGQAARKIYKTAPPSQNVEANKIIVECYNAEFSLKDTLKMIEDLKQDDGTPYSIQYITTLWSQLGFKPRREAARPVKVVAPPAPAKEVSISDLIFEVLSRSISKDEKALLIERVLNREPIDQKVELKVSERAMQFIYGKDAILTLDKRQASAIMQYISDVQAFLKAQ